MTETFSAFDIHIFLLHLPWALSINPWMLIVLNALMTATLHLAGWLTKMRRIMLNALMMEISCISQDRNWFGVVMFKGQDSCVHLEAVSWT